MYVRLLWNYVPFLHNCAHLFFRDSKLVFSEGVSSQIITVGIHDEEVPEINETFIVMLEDPSGGAVLSTTPAVEVTILSNDVAHGLIRFAEVIHRVADRPFFVHMYTDIEMMITLLTGVHFTSNN